VAGTEAVAPTVSGVTVVIPTYNHGRFVSEAVRSALRQTRAPLEVIVVDDGSSDDTRARLEALTGRVHTIRQENHGVSAARNRGLALAHGALVAFLDADDLWLPDKLEAQERLFEADPGLGLVHCGVEEMDEAGNPLSIRLDGREGWVADEMLFFGRGVILGGGSAAVFPKDLLQEIGGFDEALSTSADWDVHQRIARQARVGFVPRPLVRYRRHGSNMHGNIALTEHDMLLAYAKVFSRPDAPRRLERRARASLHAMLAGSYLEAGQVAKGMRHLARAIVLRPGTALRAGRSALRRLARRP
jgi:glycosyltransferase involved in cell wall biosynthesis